MTAFDAPERLPRFERDLREALHEEAGPALPDYLSDVLLRTVEARQRPAWTFPERWLPVSVSASRVAAPFRVPWRILAVAALIVIVLAAALMVAGSRQRLPAPFGRAANGLVAYGQGGQIYTVDPRSDRATLVVPGTESTEPVWSRDGTMLAFQRKPASGPQDDELMVAAADGSALRPVAQHLSNIAAYSFSPDGRQIAFSAGSDLWIADVQQGVARKLDLGMNVDSWVTNSWLPPNGAEMVIVGFPAGGDPGLYAVDPASGTVVRTIVAPKRNVGMGASAVSPDGSRVAYSAWDGTVQDRNTYQVHVVDIDGTNDRVLPVPPGATFQDAPIWSNDGTRLVVVRGYAAHNEDTRLAILPADGSSVGVETKPRLTGCCDNFTQWAPDDTEILFQPDPNAGTASAQLLIDPSTGNVTPAAWAATSLPAWQRRAP